MAKSKHVSHSQATLIFDKPLKVWAGSAQALAPTGAVIVSLAGSVKPTVQSVGIRLPGLESPIIMIDWPDMSVPDLTREHWQTIVKALLEKKKLGAYVACAMGHGRTGTTLAILGSLLGAIPKDDCPVTWLREHYCDEMVESKAQLEYIAAVTGREVKAKAAKLKGGASSTVWADYGGSYPLSSGYAVKPEVNWAKLNDGQPREGIDECFHYECSYAKQNHVGCMAQGHVRDKKLVSVKKTEPTEPVYKPEPKPVIPMKDVVGPSFFEAATMAQCGLCQQIPPRLRHSYHYDGHVRPWKPGTSKLHCLTHGELACTVCTS